MDSEEYYIYVLSSLVVPKFYVGMSSNPSVRLVQHNEGKSRFTKSYRPWKIVYTEYAGSRVAARELEKYYKSGAGRRKLKQIINN